MRLSRHASPCVRVSLALLLSAIALTAQTPPPGVYASPTGTATDPCTFDKPCNLRTALDAEKSPAKPGSTIWLRGGVYTGHFSSSVAGRSDTERITIRNYEGERATLDNPSDCTSLAVWGNYTTWWGLEMTSSGTKRRTPNALSTCEENWSVHLDRGFGFRNNGTGTKVINSVLHDMLQGISNWGTWTSNPGLEAYGNLIYYNGFEQQSLAGGHVWDGRGIGHGIYSISKKNGPTVLKDNILHSQFSQGIRMGDDGVFRPHVEGNIAYLNGEFMFKVGGGRNIYVGGSNDNLGTTYEPMTGAIVRDNYTYYRLGASHGSEGMNVGLWWPRASGEVIGNYIAGGGGGDALILGYDNNFTATRCTGNTVIGSRPATVVTQCPSPSNTYLTDRPAMNKVVVRPNAYEPGRAHLAIYNWQMLDAVQVSLHAAGLAEQQAFEVRDAMNFYGKPVATGTFSKTATAVRIPMKGLVAALPVGVDDITPEYRPKGHTAPEFGAFIVLPGKVETPKPPAPVACEVSAWTEWQPVGGGEWSACTAGQQSRAERRTRTITVPAANGGAACPALGETRTRSWRFFDSR